jgi:hypothetical protein
MRATCPAHLILLDLICHLHIQNLFILYATFHSTLVNCGLEDRPLYKIFLSQTTREFRAAFIVRRLH